MGIFNPRLDPTLSEYNKTRYLIVWRLLLVFIAVFGGLTFIFSHSSKVAFVIYLSVFLLSVLTSIYIRISRNFTSVYYIFSFSASGLITYSFIYLDNTLHYPDFFWIIAIILFAFVGLGRKWAVFFIIYHNLTISYYFLFCLNRNLENAPIVPKDQLIGILTEMLLGLLMISYLLYVYVKFKDYYELELKMKNENLEIQNKMIEIKNTENVTLIKEVHHRVKNNLQIVISLLRMQASDIKNQETKDHFSEAIGRIMTISMIHQKLYEQKNISDVKFENYLKELVEEIKILYHSDFKVEIDFDQDIKGIGLKSIVPIGLILNELITNSVKHNQIQEEPINISIIFKLGLNNSLLFVYSDNGKWKEANDESISFGLELISVLTDQMEGQFERDGTTYLFSVKNLEH